MNPIIKNCLLNLSFGEPQEFKDMTVFPLLTAHDGGPDYMTLKEALERALLVVTEVSSGGTVPELKVTNKADISVLLLDGEELAGAKQNRVLNTTILVKEKSETVIPVSCTEQGRWAYVSRSFHDSDTVMSPSLRSEKARTVATSLNATGEYRSDQGTVWREIDKMATKAETVSRTGAMKDIYEQKMKELDEYLKAFSLIPTQKGVFVFIGGEPVGLDFVSKEKAFEKLFAKLIRSYAMEAILEHKGGSARPDKPRAGEFLKEASECKEKKYESVGKGWDYRYEAEQIVGSALAVEDKVVHMAFFRVAKGEKTDEIASTSRRKRFRIF